MRVGTPERLVEVLAVAKKMLILIYTLWQNGQEYDPEKNVQNRLALNTV